MLIDRGFTLVRPLEGGFDAWVNAGYPVEELDTSSRA
jgi:rhodanese-related sulfurtransferase